VNVNRVASPDRDERGRGDLSRAVTFPANGSDERAVAAERLRRVLGWQLLTHIDPPTTVHCEEAGPSRELTPSAAEYQGTPNFDGAAGARSIGDYHRSQLRDPGQRKRND